jgi:trehalose-phosphatase
VVIVSGRPLAFLQQAAEGIPLVLIGSHGAESTLRELAAKLPKPASPALERELREAESSGFLVERKPYGRAVHFRALAEEQRKRVTERWASRLEAVLPAGFAMLHGNAVLEIRPTAMNKGAPLPKLRTLFNQPIAVALGDDTTDEDMFAALGRDELGVLVGARRRSLAAYHLPGVTAVREYLTALALT